MRRGVFITFGVALILLSKLSIVVAETARFALVVGNNRGDERRATLRYAERDAKRVGDLLERLGGFSRKNIILLRGEAPTDVYAAMDRIDRCALSAMGKGAERTLLVVYYSGHADGTNLELGADKLPFTNLRERVRRSRVTTKVLIIDACQSGGITIAKGGRAGPEFEVAITDSLDTNGTAILTSSAPGEKSYESEQIGSSYFTHYLLSGLRGTADYNGDKRITLGEVYQYAYSKTVVETSRTVSGTQHPTYDYQITGRGSVVLTDIETGEARLGFGADLHGLILVSEEPSGEFVAELDKQRGSSRLLSLSAGDYRVTLRRRDRVYAQKITLEMEETHEVEISTFRDETRLSLQTDKGRRQGDVAVFVQYGLLSSALKQLVAIHEGLVGARFDLGPISAFAIALYGGGHVREGPLDYRIRLIGGDAKFAWRFEHSLLDLFVGVTAGGIYGIQNQSGEPQHRGTIFTYGGFFGLDFPFWKSLSACFFWDIGGQMFVLDNARAGNFATRGSLGAAYSF